MVLSPVARTEPPGIIADHIGPATAHQAQQTDTLLLQSSMVVPQVSVGLIDFRHLGFTFILFLVQGKRDGHWACYISSLYI